jgi:superfamily II DNA or RNA helicase
MTTIERRTTHESDVIVVHVPYAQKERVKQLPGSRWDPHDKIWTMPLTWASCVQLRAMFGDDLIVGPELAGWSNDEFTRRVQPATALRTRIDRQPGDWDERLYDFQTAGAEFLRVAGDALLGDDMGVGKTAQILATVRALDSLDGDALPALVICPNSVKTAWEKQLKLWKIKATPYVLTGGAAARLKLVEQARLDPRAIVIVNVESVRLLSRLAPFGNVSLKKCRACSPHGEEGLRVASCEVHRKALNGFGFKTVILDEAHRCKEPSSKQTRAVWAVGHDPSVKRRWALTGTPIANHIGDLWSVMHFVAPYEYPTKSKYVDRYCTPPDAPVWMADGTFKAIGDINVGDFVVGFSKEPISGQGKHPRFIPSQVTAVNHNVSERLRVTLKSGRQVICTPNHRWFTEWHRQRSNSPRTMVFSEVAVGKNLRPVIKVPPPLPTELIREAAWLGGMYDGEGSGLFICQSQAANPDVYAEIERVLKVLEFEYTEANGMGFRLLGGRNTYAKFFAWCQPVKRRIMSAGQRYEAAHRQYFSSVYGPHAKWDEIVSIESLGEGPVVSLTTETETYVVYGYASHNSLQAWNAFGGLDIVGVNPAVRDEFFRILDARFRRTPKALVLTQLPKVVRVTRWVDMVPKQKRAYDDMAKHLITRLDNGQILVAHGQLVNATRLLQLSSSYCDVEQVEHVITARMECACAEHGATWHLEKCAHRDKQNCWCYALHRSRHVEDCPQRWQTVVTLAEPSPKLDAMEEAYDELGGKPVVIAAESRQLIELAAKRFGKRKIPYGLITGSVDEYNRHRNIQRFIAGDLNVMLMTIKAGGTGVDGLQHADTMFCLQRSWSMVDNVQVDARVDRIGSEKHSSVTVVDFVTRGSIEEEAQHPRLAEKYERLEEINRDRERLIAAHGADHEALYDLDQAEQRIIDSYLGEP